MACIFKRGKTWSYSVDLGRDESGKRKKKGKGGFRTQKEAKEAAAIIEAEIAGGIFIDEKKATFEALADQWLDQYKKGTKLSTIRVRELSLIHLKKKFKNVLAKDITKMKFQNFLQELSDAEYSENTIQTIKSTASIIFKFACKYDMLRDNPVLFSTIPKKAKTLEELEATEIPNFLEKNELANFLKIAKESYQYDNYAIFLTLAYTGMRCGELVALKWSDIDFINNIINITKNIFFRKNKTSDYILQPPKTKKSKRKIPVTKNIIKELQILKRLQLEKQLQHRKEWLDENFIFTSPQLLGYPLNTNTLRSRMKSVLEKSCLNSNLTPHSLRHTHTSLLAEAGVSLEAIMERLGHSNDTTTRNIYLHVTQKTKKDAAQKFYELMGSI